jgi:hypothetical protein
MVMNIHNIQTTNREIVGLYEEVLLIGNDMNEEILARIDSGATNSSIDINLAKKLNLPTPYRKQEVKQASGTTIRPVVFGRTQIAGKVYQTEFTLADRSNMTYPVLIGQNLLKQAKFIIDPLKN